MAADLANRPYIKFSSDVETKPPNEDEDIQAVADMINVIQKAQFNMHRHCYSGEFALQKSIIIMRTLNSARNSRQDPGTRQGQIHRVG